MGTKARGLDELLGVLLEEVALCGEQGATPSQLRRLIENFYESSTSSPIAKDTIPSRDNGDDEALQQARSKGPSLVDDKLLEKVWGWLIAHADICLEQRKNRAPRQIDGVRNAAATANHTVQVEHDHKLIQQSLETGSPTLRQSQWLIANEDGGIYVRAVENRMWHTLTGHGVDFKRVPAMEFTLLSLIGAAGPQGIRQPDLIHLSGQDKRSLPHRTDELQRKGYIEKTQIRLRAHNSSLCRLRRFCESTHGTVTIVQDWSPEALYKEIYDGGALRPVRFLDIVLHLVKEAGTLTAEAFRKHLNISSKLWERKVANILLRCMETVGCIRRQVTYGRGSTVSTVTLRSVTYLRDISTEERLQYEASAGKNPRKLLQTLQGAEDAESEEELIEANVDASVDNVRQSRTLPRWDPERPLLNMIHELADEHGPHGISSMDLADNAVGSFWRRPLEHTLTHVTDVWQESQPPYLRHLSIVRDTAMNTRSLHYQYRTFGNFGPAVEAGEASWEAVNDQYLSSKSKLKEVANSKHEDAVDVWGFPAIKPLLFLGRDGNPTLSECRRGIKFSPGPFLTLAACMSGARMFGRQRAQPESGTPVVCLSKSVKVKEDQNKNARPTKQGLLFHSRCKKYAEYLARHDLGSLSMAHTPPGLVFAPQGMKRGRPTKQMILDREKTNKLVVPSHVPVAQGEAASDLGEVEEVSGLDQRSSMTPTVEFQETSGSASLKRDAPLDFAQADLRKKPKTAMAKPDDEQVKLDAKVKQIFSELLEMSRPGLYINPPARMEKSKGRPLKKLILVFKMDRLRETQWFNPTGGFMQKAQPALEHSFSSEDPVPQTSSPLSTSPRPSIQQENSRKRKRSQLVQQTVAGDSEKHDNVEPWHSDDSTHAMIASQVSSVQIDDHEPMEVSNDRKKPDSLNALASPSDINGMEPVSTQHYGLSSQLRAPESMMGSVSQIAEIQRSQTTLSFGRVTGSMAADLGTPPLSGMGRSLSELLLSTKSALEQNQVSSLVGEDETLKTNDLAMLPNVSPLGAHIEHNPEPLVNNSYARHSASPSQNDPHKTSDSRTHETSESMKIVVESQLDLPKLRQESVNAHPKVLKRTGSVKNNNAVDPQSDGRRAAWKRKGGVKLSAGTIGLRRSQIILKIMEQAGGVFPGDREMYYPFTLELQKLEPSSKPDPSTISRAVKNLIASGKMRKLTFALPDKSGGVHIKHILISPEISVESDKVKEVQRNMIECFPRPYIPKEIEVYAEIRAATDREAERRKLIGSKAITDRQTSERAKINQTSTSNHTVDGNLDGLIEARKTRKRTTAKSSANTKTEPKVRKKPGPKPRNSEFDNVIRAANRQAAWRKWAIDAHVEGAESSPGSGKDHAVDAGSEEEEMTEEQAALQSTFSLNQDSHNHETVRQNIGFGKGTRYQTVQNWHKRFKPALKARTGPDEQATGINSEASFGAPKHVHQDQSLVDIALDPSPKPRHRLAEPGISPQSNQPQINPKAWIACIDIKRSGAPAATEGEPVSMFYSFSEEQQSRAARKQAREEKIIPQTFNIPIYPSLIRGSPICLTLTDPDQTLHLPSGTFSTHCAVVRRVRPQLSIKPNLQRDFEVKLLHSLSNVAPQVDNSLSPSHQTRRASFESEVARVQDWEEANAELLTSRNSLVQPYFINHTIPTEIASLIPWTKPEYRAIGRKTSMKNYQPGSSSAPTRKSNRHVSGSIAQTDASPGFATKTPRKKIRGPRNATIFSEAILQRFVTTVVVVRSLIGGNESVIKWTVVQKLMPDFDRALLRQRWNSVRVSKKVEIKRMETQFHEAFLEAYERGVVPAIDYDKLDDYDWESVISWAQERMTMPISAHVLELPADRKHLDEAYSIEKAPDYSEYMKDDMYVPLVTEIRREELMHDIPFSLPLDGARKVEEDRRANIQDVARTYVRANIFTPESHYKGQAAKDKLVPFGAEILDTAINTLLSAKLLRQENKGRPMPGRNYSMSEQFTSVFRRQFDVGAMFNNAVAYKARLDTELASVGHSDVSYTAQDGDVLVVLNLIASGRLEVRVLMPPPTTDVRTPPQDWNSSDRKLSMWGFEPGYKTTIMDHGNIRFPMRMTATTSYVTGVPLPNPLPSPPAPHLVSTSSVGDREWRIPIWYDIHDGLITPIWELVVAAVMTAVVLRPGCSEVDVVKTLKGNVEVWEVVYVAQWLVDLGVVRRVSGVGLVEGGLVAMEWWWGIFGDGS